MVATLAYHTNFGQLKLCFCAIMNRPTKRWFRGFFCCGFLNPNISYENPTNHDSKPALS